MKQKPLKIRILEALVEAEDGELSYHLLKWKVYPPEQYPRAHRHSSKGGPPGCAFAIGRALNQMSKESLIFRGRRHDSRGNPIWQPSIHITSAGRKLLAQ